MVLDGPAEAGGALGTLKVIPGEGMGIVTGAPWHTQDAVAERTGTMSP